MAYFSVTDFNKHQTPDFYRRSKYAFRKTYGRSFDGTLAIANIPSVRSQVSKTLPDAYLFTSRSISLPGFRAANLPRESAQHGNLFSRTSDQTLSPRHPRQHRQGHTGTQALYTRQLCCGTREDSLRTRCHDGQPVLGRLALGSLSSCKRGRQDAYAARFEQQHSNLHSHQRRQDVRDQCARHPDNRSRQLSHHGSEFRRFRLLVHFASNTDIHRNSWQIQPVLTIIQLYRRRRQVELFFKWIKQYLLIKKFYGTTDNAVKTQFKTNKTVTN